MYKEKTIPMTYHEPGSFMKRNILTIITVTLVLIWIALLIWGNHQLFTSV